MMSEQPLQKFHTIDIHYPDLGNAPDFSRDTTNQKHYLDLGSDA